MDVISETVDLFSLHSEKEFPFNIATGKTASVGDVIFKTSSLLNVWQIEVDLKNQLSAQFSSEGAKVKKKSTDGKVREMKMERNLFGKLLCVALEKKIDLKEIKISIDTRTPVSVSVSL